MMAVAAETAFSIRWADEHAPNSATMAAMFNSRDLLGSFIFDSRREGIAGRRRSSASMADRHPQRIATVRKFPSRRSDMSGIVRYARTRSQRQQVSAAKANPES
jgi:hypothetical protein